MFDTVTLERFRAAQLLHMQDMCYIQAAIDPFLMEDGTPFLMEDGIPFMMERGLTINSFHEAVESWFDVTPPIPCGLDMRPGSERRGAQNTLLQYDATARILLTVDVNDARMRMKIVSRFGEILTTPLIFDIVSPPQRGPSCVRLVLKRIEL